MWTAGAPGEQGWETTDMLRGARLDSHKNHISV